MSLTIEQKDWVQKVSSLAISKQQRDGDQAQKDLLLREMLGKLDPLKEDIREGMTFGLQKKGLKGALGAKSISLKEKGEQVDELETMEARDTRGITAEDHKKSYQAMEQVATLVGKLREAKVKRTDPDTGAEVEVPLFDEDELTEEFYNPLVRERLMPENLVPNRYSKTKEMLDATNEVYQKRLEEYTSELDENSKELGILDHSKSTVKALGKLGRDITEMFGSDAKMAGNIITLVELGTTTTITVVQAVRQNDLTGSANEIIDNIGTFITTIVSTKDKELGELVGKIYTGSTSAVKIGVHLAQDPPAVDAAIEQLATGITASFDAANPGGENMMADLIGKSAAAVFRSSAKGLKIAEAIQAGDTDKVIQLLSAAAKDAIKTGVSLAARVDQEKKSEVDQEAIDKAAKEITEKMNQVVDLTTLGITVGKKVVDAAIKKDLHNLADDILSGIGDVLTGVLKHLAPEAAGTVGAAYKSSVSVGMVVVYLTKDPPDQSGALKVLGAGFGASLSLIRPGDATFEKVGEGICKAFETAGHGVDIAKAIKEKKYGAVAASLSKITKLVVTTSLKIEIEEEEKGSEDDEEDVDYAELLLKEAEDEDKDESLEDKIKESFSDLDEAVTSFQESLKNKEETEEMARQLSQKQQDDALSELETERDEIERLLVQVNEGGALAADNRSVEKLIGQMMKDRVILEIATNLVSAGASVVEKFVEPMAIAGTAIQLCKNLILAANRAMALNKWFKNKKDAKSAMSVYSSSVQNFVKNQSEQFSHYSIQSALQLAKMIGQILNYTGVAAQAGQAVERSAQLAATAEDILYKFYKLADLERSWKTTQKAFANPENRKLGLIARSQNPTLAKYSIAWGAVVKKDAIAKSAMASCGINELTLSQKDTNVNNVQRYLEVCFPEDNVVLKRFETPEWMPGKVELNSKCWSTAKARGVRKADLLDQPTGSIDEGLAAVARWEQDAMDEDADLEKVEDYIQALESLEGALAGYLPVHAKDKTKIHTEMRELVTLFTEEAQLKGALAAKHGSEIKAFQEELQRLSAIDVEELYEE